MWGKASFDFLEVCEFLAVGPGDCGPEQQSLFGAHCGAYYTLGNYESVTWIDTIMDAYTGQNVLDESAYARRYQRYFPADANADNDTARNIDEWEAVTPSGVFATDIAAFTAAALDPTVFPTPGAKSTAKQVTPNECPNADCIPVTSIIVVDPNVSPFPSNTDETGNHVLAIRGDTGEAIALNTPVEMPIGTKLTLTALENNGERWKFMRWYAPNTLIDGSRLPQEEIYVTGGGFVNPIFQRNVVIVPKSSAQTSYSVRNAYADGETDDGYNNVYWVRPDEKATLIATNAMGKDLGWYVQPCYNCAAPSQSVSNSMTVRGAPKAYAGLAAVGDPPITYGVLSLEESTGGDVRGSANAGNFGTALEAVRGAEGALIRVDYTAHEGYFLGGAAIQGASVFVKTATVRSVAAYEFMSIGEQSNARASFAERNVYTLTLKPGGDDVPCSGYVFADPAKKYYEPGTEVTLEAVANPGYTFVGWEGDAWGTGNPWGNTEVPVAWLESNEINIAMTHYFNVTAVFEESYDGGALDVDTCEFCLHLRLPDNDGSLVNDAPLSSGTGYYFYDGTDAAGTDKWGCKGWIHKKLKAVGIGWGIINPAFGVGDISLQSGGYFYPHANHQNGLDVDVRYIRTDGETGEDARLNLDNNPSLYDQEKTQELVDLFLAQGASRILANEDANLTGVVQKTDHIDHFHVEFPDPDGSDN